MIKTQLLTQQHNEVGKLYFFQNLSKKYLRSNLGMQNCSINSYFQRESL